jgi:hypothetical protein
VVATEDKLRPTLEFRAWLVESEENPDRVLIELDSPSLVLFNEDNIWKAGPSPSDGHTNSSTNLEGLDVQTFKVRTDANGSVTKSESLVTFLETYAGVNQLPAGGRFIAESLRFTPDLVYPGRIQAPHIVNQNSGLAEVTLVYE